MSGVATERPIYSARYVRWLLLLLFLVNSSASMDRTIVASLGQYIKRDMGISDFQLGMLGGLSFAVFYALMGLPIAWLADRTNRTRMVAAVTAIWSAMTALSGAAGAYWQLFLFRIGVGFGEAGCLPCAHSLISDHVPRAKRGAAIAIFTLGIPAGALAGAMGGGFITQNFHWRWAFVAAGGPGLIIALLCWLTLKEPPRGYSDGAAVSEPPPLMASVRHLFAKPSFVHLLIGSTLTVFAINGMFQFVVPLLVRTFHLMPAKAGLLFGLVNGVAAGAGTVLGGYFADWAGKRDQRWYVWTAAIGMALAGPFYLIALRQPTAAAMTTALAAGAICHFLYAGPSIAAVQTMAPPRMRAAASAVMSLGTIIIGSGLGPTIVGLASDILAARAFTQGDYRLICPGGMAPHGAPDALRQACGAASATGVGQAMTIAAAICIWAALHYLLAARTLRKDLEVSA